MPTGWLTIRIRASTYILAKKKAKAWARSIGLRPERSLSAWVDRVIREADRAAVPTVVDKEGDGR